MKILSAVCLILGCFLGAGFVSGREVASYFSRFGFFSSVTCIIAGTIFFLLTMFFFFISNHVKNLSEFISLYFNKCKGLVEWLFAISILIVTGTMIAGTSALADSLGYNKLLVVGLTLVLTFLVIKRNIKGLERTNIILVPFLVLVLILSMKKGNISTIHNDNYMLGIVNGAGYVFMNIVSLGLLIIQIGHKYSNRDKILIAIISTIIITVLLLGVNLSIISNELIDVIMPNLYLSRRHNLLFVAMQISIYIGLFTTLISNAYLLGGFVNKYVKRECISLIISLLSSLLVSCFGFDNLVGYVYLFIAGVGVFIVAIVLLKMRRLKYKD